MIDFVKMALKEFGAAILIVLFFVCLILVFVFGV
jgi:hypothetical protein